MSKAYPFAQAAALSSVTLTLLWLLRRSLRNRADARKKGTLNEVDVPAAVRRCQRFHLTMRAKGKLPPLPLNIHIAGPPNKHASDDALSRPLFLYVLDPEPLMFSLACSFAFAQAGYFSSAEGNSEAQFRRMYIVGVGHAAEDISLDADGFSSSQLRSVRRRDFPPYNHPEIVAGGGENLSAQRFVEGLVDEVIPFVEEKVLQSRGAAVDGAQRCILGASYSGVVALQVMLYNPVAFKHLVLGSPSVCFDMAFLDKLRSAAICQRARDFGIHIGVWVGADEKQGKTIGPDGSQVIPGNVHDRMVEGCVQLVSVLRDLKLGVSGVHEFVGEDHGTMKLPLISRGLMFFAAAVVKDLPVGAWTGCSGYPQHLLKN